MAEIDSLELKISSEVSQALESLEKLRNGLASVSGQLSAISKQPLHIKLTIEGGVEKRINRLEQYMASASKKMAGELADAFNVDKPDLKELQGAVNDVAGAALKSTSGVEPNGYGDAVDNLGRVLLRTANDTRHAEEEMEKFYRTLLSVKKIKIAPQDIVPDEWTFLDGALRGKLNYSEGTSLDSLISEWRNQFQGVFNGLDVDSSAGQISVINDLVKKCRKGIVEPVSADDVWDKVVEESGKLYGNIEKVKSALQEMGGEVDTVEGGGLAELSSGIKKIASIDAANLVSVTEAIKGLMNGLAALNGLEMDGNAVAQASNALGLLAKSVREIDVGKMASLGASLSAIVEGFGNVGEATFNPEGISAMVGAVSKLGSKSAEAAAESLNAMKGSLAQFVGGMNGIGSLTFNTESLAALIQTVSKIGWSSATAATQNLASLKGNLEQFVRGMNEVGSLTFNTDGLAALIASIGALGRKSAAAAVENIPQLAAAVDGLMSTLSKSPAVSGNVIQMTQALADLASQGGKSGNAAGQVTQALSGLATQGGKSGGAVKALGVNFLNAHSATDKLSKSINGLSSSLGSIGKGVQSIASKTKSFVGSLLSAAGIAFSLYEVAQGIRTAIDVSSQLAETQNRVDVAFGSMKQKIEDFADVSIRDFGMSELSAKKYASQIQAMGVAMGISGQQVGKANEFLNKATGGYIGLGDSMADMSVNLTKLTADLASFYDVEQDAVADDLQSIFTGQSRPLMLAA